MSHNIPSFHFAYIPLNVDRSSINVFQHTKNSFSFEYAIFDPKTVHIHMSPIKRGWFRNLRLNSGIATIQQFATAMGLHQDFHKVESPRIPLLFDLLSKSFQIGSDGPQFFCGGILGREGDAEPPFLTMDGFTDDLLEILTDNPQFAFLQFIFKSTKVPKKYRSEEESDRHMSQIRFDIQHGKVERRFQPQHLNIMEEAGCFEFSPRILVIESTPEALKSKLDRLSVLFVSKGLKVCKYPSFIRWFSSFKNLCSSRKLVSPIVLDGASLMSFIAPPQRQFSHEGYTLVPNKADYLLSTGVTDVASHHAINLGVPIISGKTAEIPLLIDGKNLCRHMAVFGMTGEGKSRFIYGLIKEFHQKRVNFLIFDPKGEYFPPVKTFCDDFIYLKPGSSSFPWGINIFQIPQDAGGRPLVPVEDHIQFAVSILEHIFDNEDAVSPQMRRMLHLAVIQTVKAQGDFRKFLFFLDNTNELGMKGSYLESTAVGILNRVEKLFFGNTGRCFTVSRTTFEVADLLNRNAIIDLSAFEAMEDQTGREIFLNVVFQNLYYFVRTFRAPFKDESLPKNVFVLDEIQKLAPAKNFRSKSPESMIGRGPWTLRAYDISMIFIGTEPIIDQPMLTNTGLLTLFFTKFNPFEVANLLGIVREEYEQLRQLLKAKRDERRCILSVNGQISLLKTNEFHLDPNLTMDLEELANQSFQKQLRESYHQLYFDPIHEILTKNSTPRHD
ncbi:MAG: ATP-binding protein [Promethearchaeota archaeon]